MLKPSRIALTIIGIASTFPCLAASLIVKDVQAQSGNTYKVIYQNDCKAKLTLLRPAKNDKNILLCIPAAFTETNGGVDGFYVLDGKPEHMCKSDDKIGGAVAIVDGQCTVLSAPKGAVDSSLINELVGKHGDLFQQFQVIANGHPEMFRDNTRFQRRGIAIFQDGQRAIVESKQELTLTQFGTDLNNLGAQQLAYTDMGPWDEGWYRSTSNERLITLGKNRSLTNRQSNWLIFRQAE